MLCDFNICSEQELEHARSSLAGCFATLVVRAQAKNSSWMTTIKKVQLQLSTCACVCGVCADFFFFCLQHLLTIVIWGNF